MLNWDYSSLTRIVGTSNFVSALGAFVSPGDSLLIITSRGFVSRGVTERILKTYDKSKFVIDDTITPNPTFDELEKLRSKYIAGRYTKIVALGGGSVLDAAKVLSICLSAPGSLRIKESVTSDSYKTWRRDLMLVAIPTTSGTGAEVTPFATIWDSVAKKKYSFASPFTAPDVAILDPSLTLSLSYDLTLFTALDTISHALESIWNKNKSPVSSMFAWESLRISSRVLPLLLADLQNLSLRQEMQVASVWAGMAISQTRTAIAHSASYPLTLHYGVPHGLACSFTLPKILQKHFEELSLGGNRQTLESTKELLDSIDFTSLLSAYLSPEQLRGLLPEMNTVDRAGNFCFGLTSIDEFFP